MAWLTLPVVPMRQRLAIDAESRAKPQPIASAGAPSRRDSEVRSVWGEWEKRNRETKPAAAWWVHRRGWRLGAESAQARLRCQWKPPHDRQRPRQRGLARGSRGC